MVISAGVLTLALGAIAGMLASMTSGGGSPSQAGGGPVAVGGGGDSSGGAPVSPSTTVASAGGQTEAAAVTPTTTAKGHATTPTTAAGRATASAGRQSGPATTVPASSPATDPGLAWRRDPVPNGTPALQAVACVNVSDCWAGGYGGMLATTDGGATWSALTGFPALASDDHVAGIACPSSTECWAVTSKGLVEHTTDGGRTWANSPVPAFAHGSIFAVTCADSTHCSIVGNTGSGWTVASTANGGQVWSANPVCTAGSCADLWSITCPTTTTCLVGGLYLPGGSTSNQAYDAVWSTSDGGVSWTRSYQFPNGPSLPPYVTDVACTDSNHCVLSTQAWIASTSDGGVSWQNDNSPSGAYAVSCLFSGACWATGFNDSTVLYQPSWGAPWTAQYQAPSGPLPAISCLASGQCWAVSGWGGNAQVQGSKAGAVYARTSS